jgi:bla regulator protein BlaR1
MNPVTHLWQSTLCVGVAALLTFALRRSSARTRHGIWLFASAKFLLPLSLFVAAGSYLGAWTSAVSTGRLSVALHWLDESLGRWNLHVSADPTAAGFLLNDDRMGLALLLVWISGIAGLGLWRWRQWQRVSQLAGAATGLERGREAEALQRAIRRSNRAHRIELLECESRFEPGIAGVFRPRLLWPAGLSDRLTDDELGAIVSHEVCHVHRRDNLSALIQMVVETVFWFHPIVWWLGARLVNERERACDEEVLQMGTDKESYAEGILKVCGYCLRSPVTLVAGVGSSSLAARIESILSRPIASSPPISMRLLLAAIVIVAAGAPLGSGILSAHRGRAGVQEPAQVYRPGEGGVTQPRLIKEVKPEYTEEAMKARIQGSLQVEAVVLESGLVGDVTVVRSLDTVYGLDDQAVKAVKQWEFEPGTKDKKPVAVRIEVEMTFRLK